MNKPLSIAELERLDQPLPGAVVMSRRDKLMRFAKIVRGTYVQFALYNNLEHMPQEVWDTMVADPRTAFAAAANDPILKDAGLGPTIGDAQRFFELSRDDLHAFSCDCGGSIHNQDMADRIERMA